MSKPDPGPRPPRAPRPCPDCGQIHAVEGPARSWPAWTDGVRYGIALRPALKAPGGRRP